MAKRVTIQTVADLAGVSRGTVDRVLNQRSYVRADVRERVLDAIAQTGYISPREAHQQQMAEAFRPLHLGVLLPNEWESQFREEVQRGIDRAAEELSGSMVRVSVLSCRTDLPREAVEHLRSFREQGVDGVAVCALHDETVSQCVLELKEAGIPCITFNSDLPESGRLCFVGQDIHRTGRVAAELMSKCVDPSNRILAAVGNLKFDGHRQRLLGFQERLSELGYDPGLLLVEETFNDYRTTVEVVTAALETYPDLRGVYMANLSVTGCAEAVRSCGRRVRIICHDINDGIRELLLEGLVDFTIPQDFIRQGQLPLTMLTHYLRRGRLPDTEEQSLGIQVLCAENCRL